MASFAIEVSVSHHTWPPVPTSDVLAGLLASKVAYYFMSLSQYLCLGHSKNYEEKQPRPSMYIIMYNALSHYLVMEVRLASLLYCFCPGDEVVQWMYFWGWPEVFEHLGGHAVFLSGIVPILNNHWDIWPCFVHVPVVSRRSFAPPPSASRWLSWSLLWRPA